MAKPFLGGRIVLGTEFAGYKIGVFEPGTSTAKTTYTDANLTAGNENTHPVVLDANGAAQIYFNGNAKAIFYTSADVVVYTDDNINLDESSSSTGADNLILNGSFEDDTDGDGIPDNWTRTLYTGGAFTVDTTTQANGDTSAKFTSTGTGGGYITSTSTYAIGPSITYTVGFSLKSSDAGVRNVVEILWYKADGTASSTASTTLLDDSTTNPTSWTEKWYETASPSDAYFAKIRLTGCHSSDATAGSTWFDGVIFTASAIKRANNTFSGDNDFTGVNSGLVTNVCDGRLTLTTAVPVTTSDVTAATTVYFTPYKGNKLSLYDGTSKWKVYAFTELSIAVPATTDTMYDVFVYDNSGTPTLELTAWTNDTTRATALTTQNGVLVKTGATTRRYLGSFRTTGVSGQTEDSLAKRYIWNYYNRIIRMMKVVESTDSWTYTTFTFRQANSSASNQLDYVCGVSEDIVKACVVANASNSGGTTSAYAGIGVDSTSVTSAIVAGPSYMPTGNAPGLPVTANYQGFPGVGRHTLVWLEKSTASGTTTFYGDNGADGTQSGIFGELVG